MCWLENPRPASGELRAALEACRMEGASEETLASVSSLVTVFENSRYGVVETGRVIRAVWCLP